jgi:hypothetical protein
MKRRLILKKNKKIAVLKALKWMKGLDKVKHGLNLARVQLALEEKRLEVYKALNLEEATSDCLFEINKSKIKILRLENQIIKGNYVFNDTQL